MNEVVRNKKTGDVRGDFSRVSTRTQDTKIRANISLFLDHLRQYKDEKSVNTPTAEADIKAKFKEFLLANDFHMALRDFDALLAEIGEDTREDGTIAWYHQLGPILTVLSLIEDKTISMDSMNKHGGVEVLIRIGLRHDSLEDFGTSFEAFKQEQIDSIKACHQDLISQGITLPKNWIAREKTQLDIIMSGLTLITKKIAKLDAEGNVQYHADGRMKKESLFKHVREGARTRYYTNNMLNAEEASPFIWLLKIGDGTNNLGSMLGSPKFTALRRLKYCNEREDMYGRRCNFTGVAIKKWPEFAEAIKKMDAKMGAVLYTNIGYLEHVDEREAYPDDDSKFRYGDLYLPLGSGVYMSKSLSINVPPAFDDFLKLVDRIQDQEINSDSEVTRERTRHFVQKALKPTFYKYRQNIPNLFPAKSEQNGPSSPNPK